MFYVNWQCNLFSNSTGKTGNQLIASFENDEVKKEEIKRGYNNKTNTLNICFDVNFYLI